MPVAALNASRTRPKRSSEHHRPWGARHGQGTHLRGRVREGAVWQGLAIGPAQGASPKSRWATRVGRQVCLPPPACLLPAYRPPCLPDTIPVGRFEVDDSVYKCTSRQLVIDRARVAALEQP